MINIPQGWVVRRFAITNMYNFLPASIDGNLTYLKHLCEKELAYDFDARQNILYWYPETVQFCLNKSIMMSHLGTTSDHGSLKTANLILQREKIGTKATDHWAIIYFVTHCQIAYSLAYIVTQLGYTSTKDLNIYI